MKRIIPYLFMIACCAVSAQSRKLDSLRKVASHPSADSTQVYAVLKIATEFKLQRQYDSALAYNEKAKVMADRAGYLRALGTAFNQAGMVHFNRGEYEAALEEIEHSLQIDSSSGHQFGIARDLGNRGLVFWEQGNFPKALDDYFKALELNERIGNLKQACLNLGNIGNVYDKQKDHTKAIEYYTRALNYAKKGNDKFGIADNYTRLGIAHFNSGRDKEALENYNTALDLFKEMGNRSRIYLILGNMASVFYHLGDYASAVSNYRQVLNYARETDDRYSEIVQLCNLGATYARLRDFRQGEELIGQSLKMAQEAGALESIMLAHQNLCELYELKGDDKKALEHYIEECTLRDSLFNLEKDKEVTRHELNYEFRKKQAVLKAGQEKKDLQAVADARLKRIVIGLVCALALAVGVIAFIIFRSLTAVRKQKSIIEEQKRLVEHKQKEVLDSIYYARRIQRSLLPSEKYIEKILLHLKKKS